MNSIKKGVIVSLVASLALFAASPLLADIDDIDSETQFSEAELAQILAPIALYPDSLLTHIVIASTYPLEVVQAHRWRERNSDLEASEAVELAEKEGWDPSIAALVAFPSVLERLSEDLEWTQNLGDAFLESEERVLDSIQALRQQAQRANSLDNMENMRVTTVNRQIVIEPVRREIVYVPYYDTRVVYGDWHWRRYPPVYWDHRSHFSVHFPGRLSGRFHFNAGINISFNYFFSAFNWRSRHLVVTHHQRTRHYRSHQRIAVSHGAKRWHHKPTHRRGVAYRTHQVKSRFGSHKPSRLYAQHHRSKAHNRSLSKHHGVYRSHKKHEKRQNRLDRKHSDALRSETHRKSRKSSKDARFKQQLKNRAGNAGTRNVKHYNNKKENGFENKLRDRKYTTNRRNKDYRSVAKNDRWHTKKPTLKNRERGDVGTQSRRSLKTKPQHRGPSYHDKQSRPMPQQRVQRKPKRVRTQQKQRPVQQVKQRKVTRKKKRDL